MKLEQTRRNETVAWFLRLCLRGRWDPAALRTARALVAHDDLDWDALRQVAHAESLAPLLYPLLRGQDLVPEAVEQDLRRAWYHTAGRHTLLRYELESVLRHLATEGVPVILLKGAALAEVIYGSATARPMLDLDLLVHRADVPVALRVLSESGYATVRVEPHPGASLAYESQVRLRKPGQVETLIEVHWSLIDFPYYQYRLPMDWFWQTALPARIGDTPGLILGPEAQVLHLCAHLLLHHGSGAQPTLLWLHDVAEVVFFYAEQIDWQQVMARAQAYDLVLPVQQVLTQVAGEWGAPIPGNVLEQLGRLRASPAELRAFTWLTADHRPVAQRFWVDLVSMPGWQKKLRYAWINLVPSLAYMQHRYHIPSPFLVPLYYPYRWLLGLRSALQR
jgi:hypothetical protein